MRPYMRNMVAIATAVWFGFSASAQAQGVPEYVHGVPAGGYVAGTEITVTNTFDWPKAEWVSLLSLACQITPPDGWVVTPNSVGGEGDPELIGNTIIFWDVSASPITFFYKMTVPSGPTTPAISSE
jgi:hypothetical protein